MQFDRLISTTHKNSILRNATPHSARTSSARTEPFATNGQR